MSTVEIVRCRGFATDSPHKYIGVHGFSSLPGVEFWSLTECRRSWAMHHDTFTAVLLSGESREVRWQSRGCSRQVRPASIQLMDPDEVHVMHGHSSPVSSFMVCWHPSALRRAAIERGVPDERLCFRAPQVSDAELAGLMQTLQGVLRSGDLARIRLQYELCTDRVLELADTPLAMSEKRIHHPRLRRALRYLHEHYAQTIPLEALAQHARLSKYHFARSFGAMTGLTPHRYQTLLRLQSARRSIEAGASVEAAAGRVGFSDAPHLTRLFRTWLGVSPGAWARGHARPSSKPPRSACSFFREEISDSLSEAYLSAI